MQRARRPRDSPPRRVHELIQRIKARKRPAAKPGERDRLLVSTSYGGGTVPGENVVRSADFLLLHGNGVSHPERIVEMIRQARAVPGYRPTPIVFNEDDHYAFDQPANNLLAVLGEHASWGFYDGGDNNYQDGYQSPPVRWAINTPRKRAFFGFVSQITGAGEPSGDAVYPGKSWQRKSPQDAGFDPERLAKMAEYIGGIGCVVQDGYLLFDWGGANVRHDVASACKPWFTHFLFKAIEDGKLESVDQRIVEVEPRLEPLNAALGYKDRDIRWRNLATQSSCYGVTERPGAAYDYSDFNMALFFDSLFYGVYDSSLDHVTGDVLHPQLTDILECEDDPRFNARGRLAISPRDFARFGLLYLRRGNWRGRQLLSPEHVHMVLTSPLSNDIPRTEGKRAEMIAAQRLHRRREQPDRPPGQLQLRLVDQRR